jgi:hypothetical protein
VPIDKLPIHYYLKILFLETTKLPLISPDNDDDDQKLVRQQKDFLFFFD